MYLVVHSNSLRLSAIPPSAWIVTRHAFFSSVRSDGINYQLVLRTRGIIPFLQAFCALHFAPPRSIPWPQRGSLGLQIAVVPVFEIMQLFSGLSQLLLCDLTPDYGMSQPPDRDSECDMMGRMEASPHITGWIGGSQLGHRRSYRKKPLCF